MITFDSKTAKTLVNGNRVIFPENINGDDMIFKSSYVVNGDIIASGKIYSQFDLYVIGDINAQEIDVKGKLICLGCCKVDSITVLGEIQANEIIATNLTTHDKVFAQEIDVEKLEADENITVDKTLSISEVVDCNEKVICGETAYGAGKLIAKKVVTGDELDLDNGVDALYSPYTYKPQNEEAHIQTEIDVTQKKIQQYKKFNNFGAYIDYLLTSEKDKINQDKYNKWADVLNLVYNAERNDFNNMTDISLLVWLTEIVHSTEFYEWEEIKEWHTKLSTYFNKLSKGENPAEKSNLEVKDFSVGDHVIYSKYGKGEILSIENTINKGKPDKNIKIHFQNQEQGKTSTFVLSAVINANSLKLDIENTDEELTKEKIIQSIVCNVNNYNEWLSLLKVINYYKDTFVAETYKVITDLVMAHLGLKNKFINDRLSEKGW